MYKVFVNEKKLSLSNQLLEDHKNLHYENPATIEMAIDLLENTSHKAIHLYHEDLDLLWTHFKKIFRLIEAAGGLVVNPAKEILFIRRLGKWDLPKGKIERGETWETAALREIEEETGLANAEIVQFLATTYHLYTERNSEKILKATHWFLMSYEGKTPPKPQIEEGILDASWKDEDAISKEVLGKTFKNIELVLSDYKSLMQ